MVSSLEASGLLPARYFSEVIPESRRSASAAPSSAPAGARRLARAVLRPRQRHRGEVDDIRRRAARPATSSGGRSRPSGRRHVADDLPALPTPGARAYSRNVWPKSCAATRRLNRLHAAHAGRRLPAGRCSRLTHAEHEIRASGCSRTLRTLRQRFRSLSPRRQDSAAAASSAVETLPKYPIDVFWSEANDGWIAKVPDLPSLLGPGRDAAERGRESDGGLDHWFALAREEGRSAAGAGYRARVDSLATARRPVAPVPAAPRDSRLYCATCRRCTPSPGRLRAGPWCCKP